MTSLPNSIGNLINLTELYLGNNQLKDLPKSFSSLSNLVKLRISSNCLETISEVITQLVNLKELDFSINKISFLPKSISQLTNLKELFIGFNELRILPEEIGKLTNLIELSLANNKLEELPEAVGKLTSLKQLCIKENQLVRLPKSLILLNLNELNLDNNLLLPIPPEISVKGIKAIVSYYLQLQQEEKRSLNEAKLLIVGQGSVGKTSLMKRIIGQSFDPNEHKTEGINIQTWNISIDDKNIQLNVWDFGGQEIMHATHQFFLTKRSLYLLVLDSRIGEEENRIEYWLKMIQSFGEGSPVIIVGNKRDQQSLYIDRRGLQIKYSNIKAFVETSCLNSHDQGITELKTKIQDLITQALTELGNAEENVLKHIRDTLPLSWFNVKMKLRERAQEQNFISYETYEQICQTEGITEDINQSTLIQLLHDLGIVLNYRGDPRLEDTNILNPEWVTSGVYCILNDNLLMTEFKGILECNQLNRILKSKRYPSRKYLFFLINIMRKFELCFEMDGFYDEKYLVPDLLPKEEPYTGNWQNALAFEYHYPILPSSIISRFIVRMNDKVYQRTYWRSGVILAYENNIALVKADREDKRIVVRIQNAESVKHNRRRFLAIIRSQFDTIHRTIPGLVVEQKVPLPDHPNILLDYQNLLDYEEMGESFIIPPGLKERVNVKALLDGIESQPDRQRRKENTTDLRNELTRHYTFIGESTMSNIYQSGLGDNIAGDKVMGDKNTIDTQINNSQDLAQAAQDITNLLDQLSEKYPSDSSRVLGAKAVDQVDRNPELRSRILRGIQAGSFAALEKMIEHPVAKFFIEGAKEVLKP
nr:COR domain-containing protein [Nostoc sp. ChiSLP03a]